MPPLDVEALAERVIENLLHDGRMESIGHVEHVFAIALATLGVLVREVLGHALKLNEFGVEAPDGNFVVLGA